MLRHHTDQLLLRLDELYLNKTSTIFYAELYHWYKVQKLTKKIWVDVKSHWASLLEEKGEEYIDPFFVEIDGCRFFLIYSKEKIVTFSSWADIDD